MKKTRVLTREQFDNLSHRWIEREVGSDEYYPQDTAMLVVGEKTIDADMQTTCKLAKTVVRRFFSQLKALDSGYEKLEEIVACAISQWEGKDFVKQNWMYEYGYCWSVENLGDDEWYIFLNVDITRMEEFTPFANSVTGKLKGA